MNCWRIVRNLHRSDAEGARFRTQDKPMKVFKLSYMERFSRAFRAPASRRLARVWRHHRKSTYHDTHQAPKSGPSRYRRLLGVDAGGHRKCRSQSSKQHGASLVVPVPLLFAKITDTKRFRNNPRLCKIALKNEVCCLLCRKAKARPPMMGSP